MLKLKDVVKDYVTGGLVTHALKGISINFRRNELVAILGPSGCGKTTLLNITGGLDRYTSGDLIIEGKSTKDYKDIDWDTYRNHSIGFVFQSYNLIYHRSILKNVELALTISGISKKERRQRAEKALEMVGLGGLSKKKPNQMSGGQMQRVAIARALVNNPEIVMADEPTGALDSETSVQIMDLLKEVAKDRLVIMVTHNPDLAKQYATRIITMKDGLITSDSNPYEGESEEERILAKTKGAEVSKGKKKKTSMSFVTATSLSFSNLLSKLKRTILVTIAGSIGIIGVSAVLAVSQGVRDYIGNLQNDMLSSYPLAIAEESVDLTSLLSGLSNSQKRDAFKFDPKNPKVGVDSMIDYLMKTYKDLTSVKTNTINDDLVEYIDEINPNYYYSIHKKYGIDPTNNIFGNWVSDPEKEGEPLHYETISLNGLTQRYIAELKTVKGFSSYASYVNLFTGFMKEMPAKKDYILSQYDVLGNSVFDESVDGLTLVVDKETTLTDLILGQMGIFRHDEFLNIAKRAVKIYDLPADLTPEQREEEIKKIEKQYPYRKDFAYEDLIGREYIYFPQEKIYKADDIVSEEKETVSVYIIDMNSAIPKMFSLTYMDKEDVLSGMLITMAGGPSYNGVNFIRNGEKPTGVSSLKEEIVGTWTAYNDEATPLYTLDFANAASGIIGIKDHQSGEISNAPGSVTSVTQAVKGFSYKAELNDEMKNYPELFGGKKMKIKSILRLKEDKKFGAINRGVYYSQAFGKQFIEDSNKETSIVTNAFKKFIGSKEEKTTQFDAYVKFDYFSYTDEQNPVKMSSYASSLNGDLSFSFADLFSAGLGGGTSLVNYLETDKVHLRSVAGLRTIAIENKDKEVIGYEFALNPVEIDIYPKSFGDKDAITRYLDRWNSDQPITIYQGTPQEKILQAKDRAKLSYTDTIALIVTVIDTLITTITIALVAFSSLALVVSSFMIAVITYISVVERTKEIGIIRSVGGRKKDVSRLFISETFMTGLFSGIFGIFITFIFSIVFNAFMYSMFGISGIANLTIWITLAMIAVSVVLSVVSGLIPSMKASHQDPVIALRSNE